VCCTRRKARPTRQEQLSSKAVANFMVYPRSTLETCTAQGAANTTRTCEQQGSCRFNDVLYNCTRCGGDGENLRLPAISIVRSPRALSTVSFASTASESLQPSALGAASSMVAASLVAPAPAPVSATIAHESTSPAAWHRPSRGCSRGCTPLPQDRFATWRSPPTLAAARPSSCEDHAESIAATVDSASAT
jgi:hypothetical protein